MCIIIIYCRRDVLSPVSRHFFVRRRLASFRFLVISVCVRVCVPSFALLSEETLVCFSSTDQATFVQLIIAQCSQGDKCGIVVVKYWPFL